MGDELKIISREVMHDKDQDAIEVIEYSDGDVCISTEGNVLLDAAGVDKLVKLLGGTPKARPLVPEDGVRFTHHEGDDTVYTLRSINGMKDQWAVCWYQDGSERATTYSTAAVKGHIARGHWLRAKEEG